MRKTVLISILAGLILAGCSFGGQTGKNQNLMKAGTVEMMGQLSTKMGNEWVFIKDGGEVVNVTSQKIDLDQYEGQTITIEGMFSGSTLYVDKVSN